MDDDHRLLEHRRCRRLVCRIAGRRLKVLGRTVLSNAVDVVSSLAVHGFFNLAMNVRVEAGELLVEHPRELQIFDDCRVEALTWNE